MKNAAPGDQVASGDPYFNALRAEIEKHRFYPELARPLGLVGIARFDMKIDRTGKIVALQLQESSGTELIDRAAEKMIRDTARLPPPPSDIPGDFILIWIELPIHPM
jgi:protein TonB